MGALAKLFFCGDHDAEHAGITLRFPDGSLSTLFISLEVFVQDALAHTQIWFCKGASGWRQCMKCVNSMSIRSELARESDILVDFVIDDTELVLHTDDTLRSTLERLRAAHAVDAPADFKWREMALGFTHNDHNMVLDPQLRGILRPCSQYMHDYMHVVYVDGVANITLYHVMEVFRVSGHTYTAIHDFLQPWVWPHRVGGAHCAGKKVFNPKHENKTRNKNCFQAQASELLSVLPVIAFYVRCVLLPFADGQLLEACNVYLALFAVHVLLQDILHGTVTPPMLRRAIRSLLTLFVAAYGADPCKTKFHSLIHLPFEFDFHKFLISCWVHERRHRLIKKFAQDICGLASYERSVLAEFTAHHLEKLKDPNTFNFSPGLVSPHAPSARLRRFLVERFGERNFATALESRYNAFAICARGDCVMVRADDAVKAGDVWFHAEVDGEALSMISTWDCIEQGAYFSKWRMCEAPAFFPTSAIVDTMIWSQADGVATVLLPRRLCT